MESGISCFSLNILRIEQKSLLFLHTASNIFQWTFKNLASPLFGSVFVFSFNNPHINVELLKYYNKKYIKIFNTFLRSFLFFWTLLIKIPKCDAKSQSSRRKKLREIYFTLKALQFKSGSRDAFNILLFALWFIYLFDQLYQKVERHNAEDIYASIA